MVFSAADRKQFRKWWALGGGVMGAIASASSQFVNIPSEPPYAAGPVLSSVAVAVLIAGCAIVAVIAARRSVWQVGADSAAATFGWMCGIVALCCAAAYVYLMYNPGPDWWYVTRTLESTGPVSVRETVRSHNPRLVHLILTFPSAGFLGGLASGFVLRTSWLRSLGLVIAGTAALGAAGAVVWFGGYLLQAMAVDALELFLPGSLVARVIAMFVTGWLAGYIAGAIVSLALPNKS